MHIPNNFLNLRTISAILKQKSTTEYVSTSGLFRERGETIAYMQRAGLARGGTAREGGGCAPSGGGGDPKWSWPRVTRQRDRHRLSQKRAFLRHQGACWARLEARRGLQLAARGSSRCDEGRSACAEPFNPPCWPRVASPGPLSLLLVVGALSGNRSSLSLYLSVFLALAPAHLHLSLSPPTSRSSRSFALTCVFCVPSSLLESRIGSLDAVLLGLVLYANLDSLVRACVWNSGVFWGRTSA